MNKYWLHGTLACVITLMHGCASTPAETAITSDSANKAQAASVIVIANDQKLVADTRQYNSGASMGIIGNALDARAKSKANQAMESNVTKIEKHSDTDFSDDLYSEIAKGNIFNDEKKITLLRKDRNRPEQIHEAVKSAPDGPVVTIQSSFKLDATFRVMIIQAAAYLWNPPRDKADRIAFVSYQSAPVSPQAKLSLKPDDLAEMTTLWIADNASLFRKAYATGMSETIEMLRMALKERPSSIQLPTDTIVQYVDYSLAPDPYFFNWKLRTSKLVRMGVNRKITLTEDGEFISLPVERTKELATLKN